MMRIKQNHAWCRREAEMEFGDEIPKRVLGRQPYRSHKRIHHQSESEAFEKT